MGAWKIKVNIFTFTTLTETNGTVLFVLEITITTLWKMKSMYVLFHCPEYDICRQEYPKLFLGTNMNIKNISDYDNQETIAKLLWNIRMTRIKLGVEC